MDACCGLKYLPFSLLNPLPSLQSFLQAALLNLSGCNSTLNMMAKLLKSPLRYEIVGNFASRLGGGGRFLIRALLLPRTAEGFRLEIAFRNTTIITQVEHPFQLNFSLHDIFWAKFSNIIRSWIIENIVKLSGSNFYMHLRIFDKLF